MNLQLNNKTALVTGSTAGIGLAIAQQLLQEGATVYINGRTQQRVDEAIAELRKAVPNANVKGVVADFAKPAEIDALLKALPAVDILINNVGIFKPQHFTEITDADWIRFYEINVLSGVRLSRHYLPKMLAANWGRIIFISSESAVNIPEEMIHYGMTKTAQLASKPRPRRAHQRHKRNRKHRNARPYPHRRRRRNADARSRKSKRSR